MARPIQEVSQDRLAKFNEIVKDLWECKAHIKATQEYMQGREDELIELFSSIEPTSDFEGTESMKSDLYQVGFLYKLTRKVDKEKADEILDDEQKYLMNNQFEAMTRYSDVLGRRIYNEKVKTGVIVPPSPLSQNRGDCCVAPRY